MHLDALTPFVKVRASTEESLPGTWAAFDRLPKFGECASQIASQILGASGQTVAQAGATGGGANAEKTIATIGKSHVLTLSVTTGHDVENGGSGGARTRNLCRDRAAL